jgi:hypothetical protein
MLDVADVQVIEASVAVYDPLAAVLHGDDPLGDHLERRDLPL